VTNETGVVSNQCERCDLVDAGEESYHPPRNGIAPRRCVSKTSFWARGRNSSRRKVESSGWAHGALFTREEKRSKNLRVFALFQGLDAHMFPLGQSGLSLSFSFANDEGMRLRRDGWSDRWVWVTPGVRSVNLARPGAISCHPSGMLRLRRAGG
jgi:hypothetical protein